MPRAKSKRLELEDGDFIDLELFEDKGEKTVMLLHGLEGSSESHYIAGLTQALLEKEFNVIVMHFRGCSGTQNRLTKSYHSGVSTDLQEVLQLLSQQEFVVDFLVGFSLGGNVLLKWLGENSEQNIIKGAVAVSVPLLLDQCADSIQSGFSRIYQKHLLDSLKIKTLEKFPEINEHILVDHDSVAEIDSFWQFDELVTAPLNGFKNVNDYYQQSSARQFLRTIKTPTLIIHSKDDPFMNESVIPAEHELPTDVTLELSLHGGHVGFVEGDWPWTAEYYLEKRIPSFLDSLESMESNLKQQKAEL